MDGDRAVLAIDIGGTKLAAAIVHADGRISHARAAATPARVGATAILAAAGALGREVRETGRSDGLEIAAVGVGAAGLIDRPRGVVLYATDNLVGWTGTAVADALQTIFQLPVTVDNDVNALALGEQHFGAGRGLDHTLYVAVGTGIGGAMILNSQLWHGATFSAGEIGHLVVDYQGARRCSCGQRGHLEAYTAGPALAARYCELVASIEQLDLREVAARAQSGDRLAQQAIAEGGRVLGLALAGLLCTIDPQALIIGGGVSELGPEWWEPLTAALRASVLPGPRDVVIKHAELGITAVLSGAAWLALHAAEEP
ncbi:MAG: ROK family protein [Herpetosiphonaceae bacterium]|nr:ROK family protein [Herpetosiphonaceae bacterium]